MDPVLLAESPDNSEAKASFRKPSNDATNRKYRRHSPVGRSDSSSSGGSPNRKQSHSPIFSVDDRSKISDDRWRKDDGKELERESSRYRSSRGGDSRRHSDRPAYGNSHDYRRHSDYSRYERHADEEERSFQRSSRSGRESRSGNRYDHTRHDSNSDRYRDNWRDVDNYSRDKSENSGHRTKDKEREIILPEHPRHKDKDSDKTRHKDRDSEKALPGSMQISLRKDDVKTGEREKLTDKEARDDRRDRRRSPDYKNDHVSHDSVIGRDSSALRSKETHRSSNKEMDGEKDDSVQKRKHDGRENDKRKEKYSKEPEEVMPNKSSTGFSYRERDGRNERYTDKTVIEDQISLKKLKVGHSEGEPHVSKSIALFADEKPTSSSKLGAETAEIVTSKPVNSIANQAEVANDLNAAKVAAMKAAELVNRNLGGGGYLSTDQKKKLLWGSKKTAAAEESGNRWDLQLFSDRERQEKFNKLMGVKGEVVPEQRPDDKAEKQRELLNMDLEKQYTAGLRRRDGRTVGLGL